MIQHSGPGGISSPRVSRCDNQLVSGDSPEQSAGPGPRLTGAGDQQQVGPSSRPRVSASPGARSQIDSASCIGRCISFTTFSIYEDDNNIKYTKEKVNFENKIKFQLCIRFHFINRKRLYFNRYIFSLYFFDFLTVFNDLLFLVK